METDNLRRMNVKVKPSRLLNACFDYRGRCPRLPTSASDVYCLPGKDLSHTDHAEGTDRSLTRLCCLTRNTGEH